MDSNPGFSFYRLYILHKNKNKHTQLLQYKVCYHTKPRKVLYKFEKLVKICVKEFEIFSNFLVGSKKWFIVI